MFWFQKVYSGVSVLLTQLELLLVVLLALPGQLEQFVCCKLNKVLLQCSCEVKVFFQPAKFERVIRLSDTDLGEPVSVGIEYDSALLTLL